MYDTGMLIAWVTICGFGAYWAGREMGRILALLAEKKAIRAETRRLLAMYKEIEDV